MEQIYVLELEEGKYYVGKTKNSNIRIGQHFNGNGSEWTKRYKPIKIIDIKSCVTIFDEENATITWMKDKGIHNVRGGMYYNVTLTEDDVNTIKKLIASIDNKCYKCGGNHFAKKCNEYGQKPEKTKTINNKMHNEKYVCDDVYDDSNNIEDYAQDTSNSISETSDSTDNDSDFDMSDAPENTYDNNCYVAAYCCSFCGKEFDTYKGAMYHEKIYCKQKKPISNVLHCKNKLKKCYRCGRENHYSKDCYAKVDIDGFFLD